MLTIQAVLTFVLAIVNIIITEMTIGRDKNSSMCESGLCCGNFFFHLPLGILTVFAMILCQKDQKNGVLNPMQIGIVVVVRK